MRIQISSDRFGATIHWGDPLVFMEASGFGPIGTEVTAIGSICPVEAAAMVAAFRANNLGTPKHLVAVHHPEMGRVVVDAQLLVVKQHPRQEVQAMIGQLAGMAKAQHESLLALRAAQQFIAENEAKRDAI